jgi:hypothetical protein
MTADDKVWLSYVDVANTAITDVAVLILSPAVSFASKRYGAHSVVT